MQKKGLAQSSLFFIALFSIALSITACSKNDTNGPPQAGVPIVQSFPIENTKFKNCHFKIPAPVYFAGAPIPANPIQCDEGVATSVQLLSKTTLPKGLVFSNNLLSLTGTPTEKISNAPYAYYIENEAGYLILHLTLTVK